MYVRPEVTVLENSKKLTIVALKSDLTVKLLLRSQPL